MKASVYNHLRHSLLAGTRCLQRVPAVMLLVLLTSVPATGMTDTAQQAENRIKTAFLYNFSRFAVWPESALQGRSEFSLCTLGDTGISKQLDSLTGKSVHGKTIFVKHFKKPEDVTECHLVFIGDLGDLTEAMWILQDQPILTVSNAAAFTEKGGIIQFKLIDNKVRFRVNVDAANSSGLTISSKLLSLAISVTGAR